MLKLQKALRNPLTSILISIVLGFIVGAVILAIAGYNPIEAYTALIVGVFSKPRYMVQVIIKSTPIILTGLSVAFAFKTGLFNIGAEGQYIVGSIAAVLGGYFLDLPAPLHFFVVIFFAMIAAALFGSIPGILKAKWGIHEVITCIMLNWIALYLNNYFISLPWLKKPAAEASHEIPVTARSLVMGSMKATEEGRIALSEDPFLSEVVLRTDMNYGIIIALIAVAVIWFLLNRTTVGYELRSVGFNSEAAKFNGINVNYNIIKAMAIAGAIAGLAGALQMTGVAPHRISTLAAHESYGFDGISVALIANSSPVGCVLAGLFFGGLKYGSTAIQTGIGAPSEIINIVIGTIIFFVAMSPVFTMIADKLAKKQRGDGVNAK